MARKKKTRKKARTANRLDYTKGGRVGYQVGGPKGGGRGEPTEEEIQRNTKKYQELLVNTNKYKSIQINTNNYNKYE